MTKRPYTPTGRPPGRPRKEFVYTEHLTPEQILKAKAQILELLEKRSAVNLSQAADALNIPRRTVYHWKREDPSWAKELELCDEILADQIEEELMHLVDPGTGKIINQAYFLARMARLKALRPNKYREKTTVDVNDSRATELLAELREAAKKHTAPATPVEPKECVS